MSRFSSFVFFVLLSAFSVQTLAANKEEYPVLIKALPQLGNSSIKLTLNTRPDGSVISLQGLPRPVAQYLEEYQYDSVILDFGPTQVAHKDAPPRHIVFHFANPEHGPIGNQIVFWAESSNDLKEWGVKGLTEYSWVRGVGERRCDAAGIDYDAHLFRYVRFTWERGYPPPFTEISGVPGNDTRFQ